MLVLDNCEHLLTSITPAIEELLGRCGQIRVVATSREGLGLPIEVLFDVGPLAPAAAVELFEARVTGVVVHDADFADAVGQICERLDRLPLALELAAARTRHLRLEEILERLTDRFDLLREGSRNRAAAPAQPPCGRRVELRPARRTGASRLRAPVGVCRRCNPGRGPKRVRRPMASRLMMSRV